MKIPLFDIDWTLLKGGNKAHADAFDYAMKIVYGVNASEREIVPDGMIDNQIIIEVLKLHNIPTEEVKKKLPQATKVMSTYFMEHYGEGESVPLKGAKEILVTLKEKK